MVRAAPAGTTIVTLRIQRMTGSGESAAEANLCYAMPRVYKCGCIARYHRKVRKWYSRRILVCPTSIKRHVTKLTVSV